jgi:hypothetical protein
MFAQREQYGKPALPRGTVKDQLGRIELNRRERWRNVAASFCDFGYP